MGTTIRSALLDFKAHKDGKDGDTVMTVSLTLKNGLRIGSASLTGTGIGDNDERQVAMTVAQREVTADEILQSTLNIIFEPNGDDTFHFDLTFTVMFSDSTSLEYNWQDQTLSENPGNKRMTLRLNKPVGT